MHVNERVDTLDHVDGLVGRITHEEKIVGNKFASLIDVMSSKMIEKDLI